MPPQETKIIIVDMDGTLADVRHRLRYIRGRGKPNWKRFFQEQRHDPANKRVCRQVRELAQENEIVIVTGRPEQYRAETEGWLGRHKIPYSGIYMRPAGDHRPDFQVKKDILEKIGKQRVALVVEDRPRVCEMYRQQGLNVVQIKSDQWNQEVNEIYQEKS